MIGEPLAYFLGFLTMAGFTVMAARSAYFNGVVDGFGYAREKTCPGYRVAGDYLRRTMAHRWPELAEDDDGAE